MLRIVVFLVGLAFISGGFFLTPDFLASIGIMDQSLASSVELTRQTALLEVQVVRWSLYVLGYLLAIGTFFWPSVSQTLAVQRFMAKDWSHPEAYEAGLRKRLDLGFFVIFVMIALSFVYLIYGNAWFARSTLVAINQEDGLIEYTSAFLLLIAAGYAAYVALKGQGSLGLRGFHGFLALLFFAMCGEEISWGQRILGFSTPDELKDLNVQQEVNLHNMFGYVFDHLFILCFFLWGCVMPLLYAVSPLMRNVLRVVRLPLPSQGLAIAILFITLYQDQLIYLFVNERVAALRLPELRELFSAAAFLLMMQQSASALVSRRVEDAAIAGVSKMPAQK